MKSEEIISKYQSKGLTWGSSTLFNHDDAIKIIDECEKVEIIIVGMDFWIKRGKDIIEINSTDYSSINTGPNAVKDTVGAAKRLVKDKLPDNASFVSFVLGEGKRQETRRLGTDGD